MVLPDALVSKTEKEEEFVYINNRRFGGYEEKEILTQPLNFSLNVWERGNF